MERCASYLIAVISPLWLESSILIVLSSCQPRATKKLFSRTISARPHLMGSKLRGKRFIIARVISVISVRHLNCRNKWKSEQSSALLSTRRDSERRHDTRSSFHLPRDEIILCFGGNQTSWGIFVISSFGRNWFKFFIFARRSGLISERWDDGKWTHFSHCKVWWSSAILAEREVNANPLNATFKARRNKFVRVWTFVFALQYNVATSHQQLSNSYQRSLHAPIIRESFAI